MNHSLLKQNKITRMNKANFFMHEKWINENSLIDCLECLIEPHDKICIEGNNQKQALLLSEALAKVNKEKINNLHVLQSTVLFPTHMPIFEKGIANKIDFLYASVYGPRFSTTITSERMPGFGGAPNLGSNPNARRQGSDSWLLAGRENKNHFNQIPHGKKLVLQIVETF